MTSLAVPDSAELSSFGLRPCPCLCCRRRELLRRNWEALLEELVSEVDKLTLNYLLHFLSRVSETEY